MNDIAALLSHPAAIIAVVGATDDPTKYGSVIYQDLKNKGYRVFPVNPGRDTVVGDQAYPDIMSLPEPPTIVNFVVPPDVTLRVLAQCLEAGLMNVWLQPGAESPEVMRYIQEHGFSYLANACIMVRTRAVS